MKNEIQAHEGFYGTSDLALAAVISLSSPILIVDKRNPRRAEFYFRQDADLDRLVDEYWKGQLKVEPQQYFNQLRIVKARLYGEE
ncbi:hypothetical protein C4568_00255 [Candidatus Parcubacteria bacterium]|nr:MAG: hypothetical protein C4568_00255 [Candidatus Parcubacteria bacterium]